MKKIIVTIMAILTSIAGAVENYPDLIQQLPAISKNISQTDSKYYYPKLLERFRAQDMSMTKQDYFHLYYGLILQSGYEPYDKQFLSRHKKVMTTFEIKMKKNESIGSELLAEVGKLLALQPFNYDLNYILGMAVFEQGDRAKVEKLAGSLGKIIDVITSSGDGNSCKTAYYVTHVHDEYAILKRAKVKPLKQTLEGHCERFELADGSDIYFNIELMQYKSTYNMFAKEAVEKTENAAQEPPETQAGALTQ